MQKKYIIQILLVGLLFVTNNNFGQESMALYYLENVPQSNLLNPAMTPRCNGYFGVPGVNALYMNMKTDLSHRAFLQESDSGNVSLTSKYFDYARFNRKMGKAFNVRNYAMLSPFSIGFRTNNGYFTFGMSLKSKMNAMFPTDFFNVLDKGFPDGSSFDFNRMGMDARIYNEYAFGYSRDIMKNLKVGARVKILQGLFSMKTNLKTFELNTSKNVWDFNVEGDILTSAPLKMTTDEEGNIDSLSLSDEYSDSPDIPTLISDIFDFTNRGLGFDLGAVYELNEDWTFSASVIDLGYIRWRKNLNSLHFEGSYEFTGLELDNSNIDSIDNAVNDLLDSTNFLNAQPGHTKFTTGLGTSVYLGGQYHVNHYLSLGLISRSVIDKKYFHQEFNLSANLNLYHFLTTNLNYNVSFTGEQYAGFGLAMKFLPLQFYLMLDNIPITFTHYVVDDGERVPGPYDMRSFNFMVGFNFIFGAKGYQDIPKIDAYSEF